MNSAISPQRRPRFYYGWVLVAVVSVMGLIGPVQSVMVLSILLKPMTEEFHWSRTAFTGALTVGTVLGGLLAAGMGPLIDRYGSRWPLVAGLALMGGSLMLMPLVTGLWQFYLIQTVGRIAMFGIVGLATMVIIPKWFVAKLGRAMALSGIGARVGNITTPLYMQLLVQVGNWRLATLVAGLTVWVVAILPAAIFVRRRPEDMGLLPDGVSPDVQQPPQLTARGRARGRTSRVDVSFTLGQVAQLPTFYFLLTAGVLAQLGSSAIAFHMIPYLTDQGITPSTAVLVLAVWSVGMGLGSLVAGFIADRFDSRLLMVIVLLLYAGGFFLLLAIPGNAAAFPWGFYQGVVQGGMLFLVLNLSIVDYFGRKHLGTIRGAISPVMQLSNAAGPLGAALAYDFLGSYVVVFSVFGASALAACILVLFARRPAISTVAPRSDGGNG